jgi:hypothetical protein
MHLFNEHSLVNIDRIYLTYNTVCLQVTCSNVTATGFSSVYEWTGIQDCIDIEAVTSQPPASTF